MSKLVDKYKYDLFLQIDVSDIYELYKYIKLRHVFTSLSLICVFYSMIFRSLKHQRWKSLMLSLAKFVTFWQIFSEETLTVTSIVASFSFSISLSSFAGFVYPAIVCKIKSNIQHYKVLLHFLYLLLNQKTI